MSEKENFYQMPKWFLDRWMKELSRDEIAVLVAVSRHYNEDGVMFASTETLMREAGLKSERATTAALEGLESKGVIAPCTVECFGKNFDGWMTSLEVSENNSCVWIKCGLVDSGVWAALRPTSRKLYLALRRYAKMDWYDFIAVDEEASEEFDEPEDYYNSKAYSDRAFDLYTGTNTKLCEYIGISTTNFDRTMSDLIRHGLVVPDDELGGFRVMFVPKKGSCDPRHEEKLALREKLKSAGKSKADIIRALRGEKPSRRKKRSVSEDVLTPVLSNVLSNVISTSEQNSPQT